MAQGYTVDMIGLTANDATRIINVTGLALAGHTLTVTSASATGGTAYQLTGIHSVRIFSSATEFPGYGNTYTPGSSGAEPNSI